MYKSPHFSRYIAFMLLIASCIATQAFGDAAKVPALLKAASGDDAAAAKAAKETLARMEDPHTAAARTAGHHSPVDPVLDALAEAARGGETGERIAALEAIAARRAIDAETTVVFLCDDPNEAVALAAIAALAELINDGDSLQDAIVLLNDTNDPKRRAALEASILASMRRLGPKDSNARDLVSAYSYTGRAETKASIVRMIAELDDPSLDALFHRAEGEPRK